MGVKPIDMAKDWLQTASLALDAKKYAQVAYSMEMAVEIALKAVLIAIHVEVPKVHDIRKTAKMFLTGNKAVPKSFLEGLDDILATFETLLRIMPIVGYGFESGATGNEIREQAEKLLPKCTRIVEECERAIRHAER